MNVERRRGETGMGATELLAKYVIKTSYGDLPGVAVNRAKQLILDCLAGMLGGLNERVTQIALAQVKEAGGAPEAGVVGGRLRTSLTNAVLVNGTSAHAQEIETEAKYAGGVAFTVIPCALAVAEKFALSGKDVITGVILGQEVHGRLGLGGSGANERGFMGISLYGPIAISAMVCRMLNMSVDQTQTAMGLAVSQCGGLLRQSGSMTHLVEAGFACRNGVTAALMARGGMTADANIIEGPGGFAEVFCSGTKGYGLDKITSHLGDPLYIVSPGIGMKKYGCCGFLHGPLEALFKLIDEQDLYYEAVDMVDVEIGQLGSVINRFPDPRNAEQAKFSLQHALGAALVDHKPELPYLRPFTNAGSTRPEYVEARKKIRVIVCPDRPGEERERKTPLIVRLKDGRTLSAKVTEIQGSADMPLTLDELTSKYKNCASWFLATDRVQRSVEMVLNLDRLDTVSGLMDLLTYG